MQRTVMPVPGSGILGGLGMGRNIQVLLIAKGLGEMVHFGKALGVIRLEPYCFADIGPVFYLSMHRISGRFDHEPVLCVETLGRKGSGEEGDDE